MQVILAKYLDSTHWLTTHDRNGEKHAIEVLASCLKSETVKLLDKIKPTKWNELKTDAINFDENLLWFDKDLWPNELNALEKHEAVHNFIMVYLLKDPDLLDKLARVINNG